MEGVVPTNFKLKVLQAMFLKMKIALVAVVRKKNNSLKVMLIENWRRANVSKRKARQEEGMGKKKMKF